MSIKTSEVFPKNVQESIFRSWDVICAFAEDLESTDENGFDKLVKERETDKRNLINYQIIEKSTDGNYRLGRTGRQAYDMIMQDILKSSEESQIRKLYS